MNSRTVVQRLKTRLAVHPLELPYLLPIILTDDSWLNSRPVLIVEDNGTSTAHMPAFAKLLHERKEKE